jgi:hypothetical protein
MAMIALKRENSKYLKGCGERELFMHHGWKWNSFPLCCSHCGKHHDRLLKRLKQE